MQVVSSAQRNAYENSLWVWKVLAVAFSLTAEGRRDRSPLTQHHLRASSHPDYRLISKMMAMSAWRNTDVREKSNLELGNLQGKVRRWEQAGKGPVIENQCQASLDMTSGLAGLCKGFGCYSRKPEAALGRHDQTFLSRYKNIISHDY